MTSSIPEKIQNSSSASRVSPGMTRVIVLLPNDLIETYVKQSVKQNSSLEEVLTDRLRSCVTHVPGRNLFFNNEQREQVEIILNSGPLTPERAISSLRRALSVVVAGEIVEISPLLLDRLRSRHFEGKFSDFVKDQVVKGLEEFAGLR